MKVFNSILALSLFATATLCARDNFDLPKSVAVGMEQALPLLVPEFRPLGWSRKGKLAWIEVVHIEGRGGDDIKYTIFDAMADVVTWSFVDKKSWEEAEHESALEISWRRIEPEFSKQIVAHNIERQIGMEIRTFPLSASGEMYHSDVQIGEEEEPMFYDTVGSYSVTVTWDGHGSKLITSVEDVTALDVQVVGYIPSPFDSRIVVVVAREIAGWEGPPNRIDLVMYSCDLQSGFRQE